MSRTDFNAYVTEIIEMYEKTRDEILIEAKDNQTLARVIADDFMMNTTYIHDDETLSKTEYFVIRALRDNLQNALMFIANRQ